MKTKAGKTALHIIGCLSLLTLPTFFAPGPPSIHSMFNPNGMRDFYSYILLIIFFYLNFYLLISRLYFEKKYISYFLVTAAAGFIVVLAPELFIQRRRGFSLFEVSHNIFLFIAVVFISLTYKLYMRWKLTEKEKVHAELSFLKAQINPHFLFNTLNSIYSLALEKSDSTAPAVVQLSGMMRYVITEADHESVPLEKEIEYIQNYIELQKIRLGNTVKIDFNINGSTENKQIAPLILISFIENAFKHGVNPEEDSFIQITISVKMSEFYLKVFNNKVSRLNDGIPTGGLGIKNSKQRLDLIYPAEHYMLIDDNEKNYTAELRIHLI